MFFVLFFRFCFVLLCILFLVIFLGMVVCVFCFVVLFLFCFAFFFFILLCFVLFCFLCLFCFYFVLFFLFVVRNNEVVFTILSAALYKWNLMDANIMIREGAVPFTVNAFRTGTLQATTISK